MRAKDKNPDISDILPSIRENGVHQTLLVRPEGKGFGIVAGRRRYYALLKVQEETGKCPSSYKMAQISARAKRDFAHLFG